MPALTPVAPRLARRSVRTESGCLVWTGWINNRGYGVISVHNRPTYVHRAAWELERGPIPDGLQLDHLCRNRACFRIDHLEPVTNKVNVLRGDSPGAQFVRGTCKRGHDLTEPGAVYVSPKGHRNCAACVRLREQQRTERERAARAACFDLQAGDLDGLARLRGIDPAAVLA